MRYKLWGVTALLAALAVSIALPSAMADYTTKARYHQHLEAPLRPEDQAADRDYTDGFSTHLPLLVIDTEEPIPGEILLDEEGSHRYDPEGNLLFSSTASGETTTQGTVRVMDSSDHYNSASDSPTMTSGIRIRIRGNSSRGFDKKGYAIKLMDEEGLNNPLPLAGMDSHHEWALHGPFLDKSLIRNYMWYNIAGEVMDYAPNVRFCEVILNGEYMGLYVLTETITAGQNGARLELSVSKKNNTFSGYCLRLDRSSPNPTANIQPFTRYARRTQMDMDIIYPGTANLTEPMAESIRQDFSDFEKALYSYDFNSPQYGYFANIDTQSFVDYFLLNELTCNYDAGWLSTYIYKGLDRQYRMCVWDFNSACDNYQESQTGTHSFQMQNCLWYVMLMKDEDFTGAIVERYRALRATFFDEDYLTNYIDQTIAYLGPAIDRNFRKWGYTFEEAYDMLQPSSRNPRSHGEAVQDMKDFLARRTAWMDENIETLRQYSAQSKIKKFNENAN